MRGKLRVKIFSERSIVTLQNEVEYFIETQGEEIEIKDIQFWSTEFFHYSAITLIE